MPLPSKESHFESVIESDREFEYADIKFYLVDYLKLENVSTVL